MNCSYCGDDLNQMRRTEWVKSPLHSIEERAFCSSECFMDHEDGRIREPFKLYDSEAEAQALAQLHNQRGFF
jgi:hypothetical protein